MQILQRHLLHADDVVAIVNYLRNVVLAGRRQWHLLNGSLRNQPSNGAAVVGRLADYAGELGWWRGHVMRT